MTTELLNRVIDILRSTYLSDRDQLLVENTIALVADERCWPRHRATYWLHRQAFPENY